MTTMTIVMKKALTGASPSSEQQTEGRPSSRACSPLHMEVIFVFLYVCIFCSVF